MRTRFHAPATAGPREGRRGVLRCRRPIGTDAPHPRRVGLFPRRLILVQREGTAEGGPHGPSDVPAHVSFLPGQSEGGRLKNDGDLVLFERIVVAWIVPRHQVAEREVRVGAVSRLLLLIGNGGLLFSLPRSKTVRGNGGEHGPADGEGPRFLLAQGDVIKEGGLGFHPARGGGVGVRPASGGVRLPLARCGGDAGVALVRGGVEGHSPVDRIFRGGLTVRRSY
mmetsp:Transcript_6527/g.14099  ORF Transcript_6527/g.14099 Transcript_6527/m.14099 type:complete len:224 (-) Transcript_6527:755-1426(-)